MDCESERRSKDRMKIIREICTFFIKICYSRQISSKQWQCLIFYNKQLYCLVHSNSTIFHCLFTIAKQTNMSYTLSKSLSICQNKSLSIWFPNRKMIFQSFRGVQVCNSIASFG